MLTFLSLREQGKLKEHKVCYLRCIIRANHRQPQILYQQGARWTSQAQVDFSNSSSSLAYSVKIVLRSAICHFAYERVPTSPAQTLTTQNVQNCIHHFSPEWPWGHLKVREHMHLLCSVSATPPTWPSMTEVWGSPSTLSFHTQSVLSIQVP